MVLAEMDQLEIWKRGDFQWYWRKWRNSGYRRGKTFNGIGGNGSIRDMEEGRLSVVLAEMDQLEIWKRGDFQWYWRKWIN